MRYGHFIAEEPWDEMESVVRGIKMLTFRDVVKQRKKKGIKTRRKKCQSKRSKSK